MKRIFAAIMALMLILSTTSQAYVVTIYGQNCTFRINSPADSGIILSNSQPGTRWWKVTDATNNVIGTVNGELGYKFIMPSSDVTVTPMLTGNQIVVQQTANGTIKYNGNVVNTVETTENQSYTLAITPNSGYEIATVKVDNVELEESEITASGMNYAFNNVTANHVITATYVVTSTPTPTPATYTVTFNANGGNGTMTSQTFTEGIAQNLSANTFTKTGYTFAGWNTKQDGTGNNYTNQASFTATENTTLYAKWTPASGTAYTVYHYVENANNSSYTLSNTENKTGTTGATITLANETTTITGATYDKGSLTENGNETTTTTINSDGTTKIYLYYTRNQYTLTLNKNDNISSVSGAGTYKYGQNVTIDATLGSTTGYNYTFTNWTSSNTSLLSNQTTKNATFTMPNGNVTLTANGAKTPITYTITYSLDGGTASNPTSYTVETESFTLNQPTKAGYTFTGWTGSNGTTAQTSVTIAKGSTGDKSYTANWEEEITLPNAPVIKSGLTPVNWNGNSWVTTTVSDWDYDYNSVAETTSNGTVAGNGNGKWANAQTADGSLYVWIPRYTYKIASGEHISGNSWNSDSNPGTNKIEIKFSNGTTDDTTNSYISHPAFTFGDDELKGIWVAKYKASRNDATESSEGSGTTVSSKPGVKAWTSGLIVSNMFDYAYNLNRSLDSHLMKNVEWGAVAYLTNAIGRIPYINNRGGLITGNAGGSQDASSSDSKYAWNTVDGVKASTTHNVYGIYDLSGGTWEYVAAYLNNGHSNLTSYASSLVNSYSSDGTKYVDVYPVGTSDSSADNYVAWNNIKGDAVYETSSSDSGDTSWDGDCSITPYSSGPVFSRGGNYSKTSSAGVFCFNGGYGFSFSDYGFRPVLAIP